MAATKRGRWSAQRVQRAIGWRLNKFGSRLQVQTVGSDFEGGPADSVDASALMRNGWTAPQVDVLFYFPDAANKIYQIRQWLPVIAAHQTELKYGIVCRVKSSWQDLMFDDDLPAPNFLATTFVSLMDLYRVLQPKAIVYPNNGLRNFQSLLWSDAAHIHVNHGESDKVSMVSNQAKAYDRVFVAGQAAVRRHRAALSEFDERHLVVVGRPQLDLNPKPTLKKSGRRTVLYAPTWEGEDEANNFTSLDLFGKQIVKAVLALPEVRLVYKPHPRVILGRTASTAAAHQAIVDLIAAANENDPGAQHEYRQEGDILALFPRTDLLISDVSSVGLDFLYARVQVPLVLTDRRTDRAALLREAPVAAAAHVIDQNSVAAVGADLAAVLAADGNRAMRAQLRGYYFDDIAPGESTKRFYDALHVAIDEHQDGLARARRLRETGLWPVSD